MKDLKLLHICITIPVFWVSSICILFISVMQSVNRAQFLNITFLFVSFTAASAAAAVFATVMVPWTSMYASL